MNETLRSQIFDKTLNEEEIKWRFNTSVAIVINANYLSDDRALEAYLTKMFNLLGADQVRMDLADFIETAVAPYLDKTADSVWTSQFQKVVRPGTAKLVKAFPTVTKMYNFEKQHYTMRPKDLVHFITEQKVQLTSMSAVLNNMAAQIQDIKSSSPTPEVVATATSSSSITAEVNQAVEKSKQRTWSKVVAKAKTKAPKQPKKAQPKLVAVCGTAGNEYSGPKQDKHLKLVASGSMTLEQVKKAVEKASGVELKEIEIELVSKNPRSYSCTYRTRIKGLRIDRHRELLLPSSWPSGMKVCEWRGAWRPLAKFEKIKLFVGNLCANMAHDKVERNLKAIYEHAGCKISSVSSEKFTGKRTKKDGDRCLNLIVALHAVSAGISMEPIWSAVAENKIPANLYIRQWLDRTKHRAVDWA